MTQLVSIFVVGLSTLGADQPVPPGYTQGHPWVGEPAITETVEEIMARDPAVPGESVLRGIMDCGPEHDSERQGLPQNPASPWISQWPTARRAGTLDGVAALGKYDGTQALAPQTLGTSFLGGQLSDAGFIPPDTMADVGPTQILMAINGRIRLFNKNGTLGAINTTTDSFFNSVRGGAQVCDPMVRYDRLSQRWFISMIGINTPNRVVLAVSSGPTITNASSFSFFQFQHDLVGATPNSDTGGFCDYTSMGVDEDAVYIGGNIFNSSGTAVVGTTGFVIRKSALLTNSLVVTPFRQMATASGEGPWSPRGVDQDEAGTTEGYFIGVSNTAFGRLTMRRILNPDTTPSISSNILLTVPATAFPITTPQLGVTSRLDVTDDRLFAAKMRKNKNTGIVSLWTAHNIQVNSSGVGSGSGGRNGSRWYELRNMTSTPTLNQSGTLFSNAASNPVSFIFPSIAMSGQGHAALGATACGAGMHPEAWTAGRLATDTLGTLQGTLVVQTSSTTYSVNPTRERWGDYTHTMVDPNDDMTIWSAQEYCNSTNSWAVRIFQLIAPPPATPTSCTPIVANQGQTLNVVVGGTSISGSGFFEPGPAYAQHVSAAFSGTGITVNSITYNSPTQLTLNVTIAAGATLGSRNLTVTNPDGQQITGSNLFTVQSGGNPVPTLVSMNPTSKIVGDAAFALTLNGTNFVVGSMVQWNGSNRSTTFVNANQLTAAIPASDLLTAGTASITVFNPSPGGGTSNALTFTINNPVPAITTLTPPAVVTLSPAFTLTVNGTGFVAGSLVNWNGSSRPTTFVSASQLNASISASDVATAGPAHVTVTNPGPGGGTSAIVLFTVAHTAVTGKVSLGDWSVSPAGTSVEVQLRAVGNTTPLQTLVTALDATGNFTATADIAPGTYDVAVKGSHWLRKLVPSVAFNAITVGPVNVSLLNGDVDGDNAVTVFDYNALSDAFDSVPGDGNWNAEADLDGDGAVTVFDYNIVSTNFDLVGDD